jgi:hypothetical protein
VCSQHSHGRSCCVAGLRHTGRRHGDGAPYVGVRPPAPGLLPPVRQAIATTAFTLGTATGVTPDQLQHKQSTEVCLLCGNERDHRNQEWVQCVQVEQVRAACRPYVEWAPARLCAGLCTPRAWTRHTAVHILHNIQQHSPVMVARLRRCTTVIAAGAPQW